MEKVIKTKILTSKDSEVIANVHLESFPSFFLTSLGKNFLKMFYHAILLNPYGIGIGIYEDEKLTGFAIGSIKENGFYLSLLKSNFFSLCYSALIPVLLNPLSVIRIFLNIFSYRDKRYVESKNRSILLSICVLPSVQNYKIGSRLLSDFESIIRNNNGELLCLTTEANNNEKANFFYVKNGYKCIDSYKSYPNRTMNEYIKKL